MSRPVLVQLLFVAIVLTSITVLALPGAQTFRVRDDCDPETFNLAIGEGTCVPTFNGGTTVSEFIDELTEDRDVGSWKFNPDRVGMDRGQGSTFESRGGEFHTFTRVAQFGGGVVPVLNDLSGAGATRPECVGVAGLAEPSPTNLYVPSGAAFTGPKAGSPALPRGTTKWQCCIHPWMKTVVTVK
jgi:hypothetical protein